MQRVVLVPSARIFQVLGLVAERQEDASTMLTAFARKVLVLKTNQTKMAANPCVGNQGNIGRQFRLALPVVKNCLLLLTLPKRAEGPKLCVCYSLPLSFKVTSLVEISACKPKEKLFRLLGSSSLHVNSR